MNLLLDTHIVIWSISAPENLSKNLSESISDEANNCFVSIASLWEIAIKHSLGKLELKGSLENIFAVINTTGFDILPISPAHILKSASLPFHHRDPFDRIIIAQSIIEELYIVTKDTLFSKYEVKLL